MYSVREGGVNINGKYRGISRYSHRKIAKTFEGERERAFQRRCKKETRTCVFVIRVIFSKGIRDENHLSRGRRDASLCQVEKIWRRERKIDSL